MRRYTVAIDGKRFVLDVKELESGQFQVLVGKDAFLVQLTGEEDLPEAVIRPDLAYGAASPASLAPYQPPPPETLRPLPHVGQPALPNHRAPEGSAGSGESGEGESPPGELRAPMPGTILSVAVGPGEVVTRGQALLVLEAMKMKNPIRAHEAAIVAAVEVQAGQTVGFGDILIRFQEP